MKRKTLVDYLKEEINWRENAINKMKKDIGEIYVWIYDFKTRKK
jgi:hypothetical protein